MGDINGELEDFPTLNKMITELWSKCLSRGSEIFPSTKEPFECIISLLAEVLKGADNTATARIAATTY